MLGRLWRRLRGRRYRDDSAELAAHLDQLIDSYMDQGLNPEEARAAARRHFGNITSLQETSYGMFSIPLVEQLRQAVTLDLVPAVRALRRNSTFSLAVIVTLGLGIGATTGILSVVNSVLWKPLPYQDPSLLVRISEYRVGAVSTLRDDFLSDRAFVAWRREQHTLETLAAYAERAYNLTGRGDAERIRATAVSPELFRMLGVSPVVGRFFEPQEAIRGTDGVVVLAHDFWQERFGASNDAIGQTITLDGTSRVIVGVAPPGFSFPDAGRRFFTPYLNPVGSPNDQRGNDQRVQVLLAVGRLAPGATVQKAEAEGTRILRGLGPLPPSGEVLFGKGGQSSIRVEPLSRQMTNSMRPTLLLLSLGVGLVLLISCANVTSLFLARGASRSREFAIRRAVGASSFHIIRKSLVESLTIAALGGIVGLLFAWIAVSSWPSIAPRGFPRIESVQVTWQTLAVAIAISLAAGLLTAAAPAIQAISGNALRRLRENSRATADASGVRLRRALLVVEAAFAVMLLTGAVLLVRNFAGLVNVDPGYDATNVLSARISLQGEITPARWQQVALGVVEQLRVVPGVNAVGAASMAPLGDSTFLIGFRVPSALGGQAPIGRALGYTISPGYAEALQLRLRKGRLFAATDTTAKPQAMIVNEEFARVYLNDGGPLLGRQFPNTFAANTVAEVVGIVGDVLKGGLTESPQPEFYLPLGNQGAVNIGREINLLIRTQQDLAQIAAALRRIVRDVDPRAPVHSINRLDTELLASVGRQRFAAALVGTFAALALILAAVGLYATLSYGVASRIQEIGVRLALGATRSDIFYLVVREGIAVTAAGGVIGLMAAAGGTGFMKTVLIGIDTLDLFSFLIAPAILIVVAIMACLLPAWRASSIAPTIALRHD